LELGRAGRLLPLALWLAAAASWWLSPVRRAGTTGLVLLPAFLLLPAAVARCWREEQARRQGLRALAGVVAGIALWALGDEILLGTPRGAAMPLGHHTLLAAWLVTLLPLAVLPAREKGGWRLLGLLAGVLGGAAVLASRSLLGCAALALVGLVGMIRIARARRGRWIMGTAALLAAGTLLAMVAMIAAGPRLAKIAAGADPSARARRAYFAAGWGGFRARPLLGWGPGAAAWTNALFFRPEPGVNPPGEAIGELHDLPLQLADELGAVGLLPCLGLLGFFGVRRLAELPRADDPGLLFAALLGLGGAGVAFLGTANLAVAALPWAVATAAGGALAALPSAAGPSGSGDSRWPVRLYAAAVALAAAPGLTAQWSYDRALGAELGGRRGDAVHELARAVHFDPAFPLYRMRLALLRNQADPALRAAQDGRGVAVLWTVAGVLGQAAQRPWAREALVAACASDPLDPFPAFFQMQADPDAAGAARHAAHAFLAAPGLAAAEVWEGRQALYAESLRQVRAWEGIDPGWKEAFLAAASISPEDRRGERGWLALAFDTDPRESISVPVFRRRPWPTRWPLVPVRRGLLDRLALPPATTLATTSPAALTSAVCVTPPSPDRRRAVTGQPLRSR
jgi:O-antigen ligase